MLTFVTLTQSLQRLWDCRTAVAVPYGRSVDDFGTQKKFLGLRFDQAW